jgi:misacylated tRNA(Ala) deacylase
MLIAELLFLRDAYLREVDATVTATDLDARRVVLDRTVFYATGGGQPHDAGTLAGLPVTDARNEGDDVWHTLGGDGARPAVGDYVHGEIDWDRRYQLMRTHTALRVLCGVIWNEWGKAVTGAQHGAAVGLARILNSTLSRTASEQVEERVNTELAAARPIDVSFLPRGTALQDSDLIRTKVG